MKKLVCGLILIALGATAQAALDLQFSNNNGYWSYDSIDSQSGVFSFKRSAQIDNSKGILANKFVNISPIQISIDPTNPYKGTIVNSPTIEIGNGLFTGELSPGGEFDITGTSISFYPSYSEQDIINIQWDSPGGPVSMDFSLNLQGTVDIATMISSEEDISVGGHIGGNMSIPESATLVILSVGSVVLLKDKFPKITRLAVPSLRRR